MTASSQSIRSIIDQMKRTEINVKPIPVGQSPHHYPYICFNSSVFFARNESCTSNRYTSVTICQDCSGVRQTLARFWFRIANVSRFQNFGIIVYSETFANAQSAFISSLLQTCCSNTIALRSIKSVLILVEMAVPIDCWTYAHTLIKHKFWWQFSFD